MRSTVRCISSQLILIIILIVQSLHAFSDNSSERFSQEIENINAYSSAFKKIDRLNLLLRQDSIWELNEKINLNETLIEIYVSQGDYDKAYASMKCLIKFEEDLLRSSIENDKKKQRAKVQYQKKIARDSLDFEYAKILNELKVEGSENKNERLSLQLQFLLGFVIIVIVGIIFALYAKRKQENQIIEIQEEKSKTDFQINVSSDQQEVLAKRSLQIIESLQHAQGIQESILPKPHEIRTILDESFVLFEPKTFVSGDFYFMKKIDGSIYIAAADSTGHGVPGATVSFLNYNKLLEAIEYKGLRDPAEILGYTSKNISELFKNENSQLKDGMDIALCKLDLEKRTALYSGAFNPLFIVRDKKLLVYKGARRPVGFSESNLPFSNSKIKLLKDDMIYLFSDGFQDQFGGEKDSKFKVKNFKNLLVEISSMSVDQQKIKLKKTFMDWKGIQEQTDDMLVIGVRI